MIVSKEEITISKNQFLQTRDPGQSVWIFTYGSLMWNPQIDYAESLSGLLEGYHRSFCCWSVIYRGTFEKPGLVLALDKGGTCYGQVLRIESDKVEDELQKVWEREMITAFYIPCWVSVQTTVGKLKALTFIADPKHKTYINQLTVDEMAACIATAKGQRGTNREYLENTVEQLRHLGISEPLLEEIHARIQSFS